MRFYADESRTQANQGQYMAIGGIFCEKETAQAIRKEVSQLIQREKLSPNFEFHFSHVKSESVHIYKQLIDIFADFHSQKAVMPRGLTEKRTYKNICFDVILIEHSKVDHSRFSKGDPELGFFQFYYTLLAKSIEKYALEGEQIHITIDHINTSNREMVPNLHKRLLNLRFNPPPKIILSRQDSKAEKLLQITDVLLGCVSFYWNVSPEQSSKYLDLKREIAEYASNKLNIDFLKETYPSRSFNIWKLTLK